MMEVIFKNNNGRPLRFQRDQLTRERLSLSLRYGGHTRGLQSRRAGKGSASLAAGALETHELDWFQISEQSASGK